MHKLPKIISLLFSAAFILTMASTFAMADSTNDFTAPTRRRDTAKGLGYKRGHKGDGRQVGCGRDLHVEALPCRTQDALRCRASGTGRPRPSVNGRAVPRSLKRCCRYSPLASPHAVGPGLAELQRRLTALHPGAGRQLRHPGTRPGQLRFMFRFRLYRRSRVQQSLISHETHPGVNLNLSEEVFLPATAARGGSDKCRVHSGVSLPAFSPSYTALRLNTATLTPSKNSYNYMEILIYSYINSNYWHGIRQL